MDAQCYQAGRFLWTQSVPMVLDEPHRAARCLPLNEVKFARQTRPPCGPGHTWCPHVPSKRHVTGARGTCWSMTKNSYEVRTGNENPGGCTTSTFDVLTHESVYRSY